MTEEIVFTAFIKMITIGITAGLFWTFAEVPWGLINWRKRK